MLGSIQITHQRLSQVEVNDICQSLEASAVKVLSLRECVLSVSGYEHLMRSMNKCKSILQLNLNLGVVNSEERALTLAATVDKNRSLTSLFIHGSQLGDHGLDVLGSSLKLHPNIVSLDVGDCGVNDRAMAWIIKLLKSNGAKRGLQDLTLSANKDISLTGWMTFFTALAAENCLKTLCLDYTAIGDEGAMLLCIALAACRCLDTVDLEGTGITTHGALFLLHLVKTHTIPLCDIILDQNDIKENIKQEIADCLQANQSETTTSQATTSSDVTDDTVTNSSCSESQSVGEVSTQAETDTREHTLDTDGSSDTMEETATEPSRADAQSLNSVSSSSWSRDSDFGESMPRFRPGSGYFAQAMKSTASGAAIDSPLHTVSSTQYAYSDVSAS